MDWKDIAGPVIKLGGGVIGGMLGMPGLGATAGGLIADALGVDRTPEAVNDALKNPSSEVVDAIRHANAEAEKEWAKFYTAQVKEVGQTMRAELAAGVSWYHWRHLLGYVVMLWAVAILPVAVRDLWIGNAAGIDLGIKLASALTTYFLALCGLLGYVAMDTTRRTTAAASGSEVNTMLGSLLGAITKKK